MTKGFRKKEFSSTNYMNHSLFTLPLENFAMFMGSYFKFCPGYGVFFQNVVMIMGPSSDFSKAHIYQQIPYRS